MEYPSWQNKSNGKIKFSVRQFSMEAAAMAAFTLPRVDEVSSSNSVFSLPITHSKASRPWEGKHKNLTD